MANGRHARGAEHPNAHLDPGPPVEVSVEAPDMPVPTGRRRRVIEQPTAFVTEVPRTTAVQDSGSTGSGRRRRTAAAPAAETAATAIPATSGRRRREPTVELPPAVAPQVEAPVEIQHVAPGSGRRRRTIEPTPVVEATMRPVLELVPELIADTAVDTAAYTAVEPASRSHRRAPAKPAKKAAPRPSGGHAARSGGHAARPTGGHAAARRKAVPITAPSGTALVAGAAAVAVAAAGVIGAMDSGSDLPATEASMAGIAPLGVAGAAAIVDSASVDREQVRASRERARDALADRVAAAVALQKKQEAAARALAAAKARAKQLEQMAKNYSLPVSGYHLTAGFGEGGYRWSSTHTGLDFACAYGSPIRAVAAGTVIFAGWDGAYGYKTIVRHADGTQSWYAHQSQILIRRGQVAAGQIIGRVGMTGNTSGPHLHLEIRVNDNAVNPLTWLRDHGLRP